MSATTAFDFEAGRGFSIVSLNPAVTECRWGEIEQVADELKQRIGEQTVPHFLMDLTRIEYMGSSVVALIVKLWKAGKERNGLMVVVSSQPLIREILETAGLAKVWTIVDSRPEAEQLMQKSIGCAPCAATTFLLTILGWVLAAGAAGVLAASKRGMIPAESAPARNAIVICSAAAIVAGLASAIRSPGIWRLMGGLLIVVSGGLLCAALMSS